MRRCNSLLIIHETIESRDGLLPVTFHGDILGDRGSQSGEGGFFDSFSGWVVVGLIDGGVVVMLIRCV